MNEPMVNEPMFALRAISVRGREYFPGDEVPPPPSLIERGLATADPEKAATLREITAVRRELRAATQRAYELQARLTELRPYDR